MSIRLASEQVWVDLDELLDILCDERTAVLVVVEGYSEDVFVFMVIDVENIVPSESMQVMIVGLVLFIFVLMSMVMVGVYFAGLMVVGEREGGMFEITLVTLVSRIVMLWGKAIFVLVFVCIVMLFNGVAMLVTMLYEFVMMDEDVLLGMDIDLFEIVVAIFIFIATALLVVALMLIIMLSVKTMKQAGNLGSLVIMLILSPAMVVIDHMIELMTWLAVISFIGFLLVWRDTLGSSSVLGHLIVLILVFNGVLALGLMLLGGWLVKTERFLFGSWFLAWVECYTSGGSS